MANKLVNLWVNPLYHVLSVDTSLSCVTFDFVNFLWKPFLFYFIIKNKEELFTNVKLEGEIQVHNHDTAEYISDAPFSIEEFIYNYFWILFSILISINVYVNR